jgi:hypothetical protein
MPKPGCGALGECAALLADNNDTMIGEVAGLGGCGLRVAPRGSGNLARIVGDVLDSADIDDSGGIPQADKAAELLGGDLISGHLISGTWTR